jgi:hypothetical protein
MAIDWCIVDECCDNKDKEPLTDIALCYDCQWKGNVSDCELGRDGDWESGYYDIHYCPNCGMTIDDYEMSEGRNWEWVRWDRRQRIRKHTFDDKLFVIE